MKIEEVRKIIAGRKPGWRVRYCVSGDPLINAPIRLTPEPTEPPLESREDAEAVAVALLGPAFTSYRITNAWVDEV